MQTHLKLTKCARCGYSWHSGSKLKMVTCPSCGNKTLRGESEPKTIIGVGLP